MKLTNQEIRVSALVAQGCDSHAIAAELSIRPGTAKQHRARVYRKLGIDSEKTWRHAFQQQLKLAFWWECELFQIGLKELGLVA